MAKDRHERLLMLGAQMTVRGHGRKIAHLGSALRADLNRRELSSSIRVDETPSEYAATTSFPGRERS